MPNSVPAAATGLPSDSDDRLNFEASKSNDLTAGLSRRALFGRVPVAALATTTIIPASAIGIGALFPDAAAAMPSPAAEPVTWQLLEAYKTWLDFELRTLCWEMADHPAIAHRYNHYPSGSDKKGRFDALMTNFCFIGESGSYHFSERPEPSTRAALVLRSVGCEWRDPDYDDVEVAAHV